MESGTTRFFNIVGFSVIRMWLTRILIYITLCPHFCQGLLTKAIKKRKLHKIDSYNGKPVAKNSERPLQI